MGFDDRQSWLLLLILCGLVVSTPFLAVQITPISDVPQQLAQIPLLQEVLAGRATDLVVHWLYPNKAAYLPLGVSWLLFEPLRAARFGLILIALVWVASVFVLARRRGRAPASAVLALPLLFNHSFGLGFLNFAIGFGAFAYWFSKLADPPPDRSGRTVFLHVLLGSLLLYYCHALWLAGGLVWLTLLTLWQRRRAGVVIAELLGALPAIALAAGWYPSLVRMRWGASLPSNWPGIDRLLPANLVNDALGSVRGPLEPLFLSVVILWLLVALWQHRRDLRHAIDGELLMTAALFIAFALLLPDQLDRTYALASRWMPVGLTCLLLALPAPGFSERLRLALAMVVLVVFCSSTAGIWRGFESEELAGVHQSLDELPDEPRLLGLDFVRQSPRIKYPPYLQMHAYGQLLRGGSLNFSFTHLGSSLVVRRDFSVEDPWTEGLEWRPFLLQPRDLDHFDYALVHMPLERGQEFLERTHRMVPVTPENRWRLMRILPLTPRPDAPPEAEEADQRTGGSGS